MANEVRTAVHNVLAYKTIDYLHQECHVGNAFYTVFRFSSMATADTMNIAVIIGAHELHWHPNISATGPVHVNLFEDCVYGATGTLIQSRNYNRCFNTSNNTLTYHSTVGSDGTAIWKSLIVGETAGGTGVNSRGSIGGELGTQVELILKPKTNYMIQLINASFTQMQLNYHSYCYEE